MFYPCCKDIKNRQNLSLDLADCENYFLRKNKFNYSFSQLLNLLFDEFFYYLNFRFHFLTKGRENLLSNDIQINEL